jgi:hypothetical protein
MCEQKKDEIMTSLAYCGKYNGDYSACLKNALNFPCLNEFLRVFYYVHLHI